MAVKSSKYVHGAVAEQLENDIYDPYEQNPVLRSKKVARNNAKLKAKITFYIFIVFSVCAFVIFRYAQISQINYETNKLKKEYAALQNENARIGIDIEKAMDLNSIREIAENKLSMHKPDKSQIVYVTIPKKDVTIPASKEKSKVLVVIDNLGNSFKRFLNIFY